MKTFVFMATFIFTSFNLMAACQTDAIVYNRSTSFGISLGKTQSGSNFSTASTINLPVFINGRAACFKKSDAVSFEAKKSKEKNTLQFLMTPVTAEFENIPDPQVVQYFDFKHLGGFASEVHVMTYICSGEIPLSKESYSDSILGIYTKSSQSQVRISSTFATGQAARNLNQNRALVNKTERHFSGLFLENNSGISIEDTPGNVFIPTVVSDLSIKATGGVERNLFSAFDSKNRHSFNACSYTFRQLMSQYLLENVLATGKKDGLEIVKKKKNQFEMTIDL